MSRQPPGSEKISQKFYTTFKQHGLSPRLIHRFQKIILQHYRKAGRKFLWRETADPYHILVSEIMLQQTQTERVAKKFPEFISAFPTIETLATAPLKTVLQLWQGLGYNRRAIALRTIAKQIATWPGGIPPDPARLITLPAIGQNTAASICAFAFNQPVVFIETNIRSVFIHFFFKKARGILDKKIVPLIAATLLQKKSRLWYYALMDYGVMIKKYYGNPNRNSKQYAKQSRFQGSNRQVRGLILKYLTGALSFSTVQLAKRLDRPETVIQKNLADLKREGFIAERRGRFSIFS